MAPKVITNVSEWMIDAQQMAIDYASTFQAPTAAELDGIAVGMLVKICDGDQRFWTRITGIDGDGVCATVESGTGREDHGYGFGQEVLFEKRHAYIVTNDKGMAMHALPILIATGQFRKPTRAQQEKRILMCYMQENWAKLGDMFGQGVGTLHEALATPVDFQRVVDHFTSKKRLRGTGLKIGDVAVMHVKSADEWTAPMVFYDTPPNLVLAEKIVATAFND